VRIFWDLDNISAKDPQHALVVGHRLKQVAERVSGAPPALTAFANERTVERLCARDSSESWQVRLALQSCQSATSS
jgi:hypothetical protein